MIALVIMVLLALVVYVAFLIWRAIKNPWKSMIHITAQDLSMSYQDNIAAGEINYTDKMLVVSGTISEIGKRLGTPYIGLLVDFAQKDGISGLPMTGVRCEFGTKDLAGLAQLSTGQTVSVLGKCTGIERSITIIKDCSLPKRR
jgi:hypothetical protein